MNVAGRGAQLARKGAVGHWAQEKKKPGGIDLADIQLADGSFWHSLPVSTISSHVWRCLCLYHGLSGAVVGTGYPPGGPLPDHQALPGPAMGVGCHQPGDVNVS